MKPDPEELLLQTWKKQLDSGLRTMEAIIQGSIRVRELQLEAATQAHADVVATRKAVAEAGDGAQLIKLQAEWLQSNAYKSLAYWRSAYQLLMEADAEVAKCVSRQSPAALPEGLSLKMIDEAFGHWLETTRRLYVPAEKAGA